MWLSSQTKQSLAHRRRADRELSESLQRSIRRVDSILIALTIAAIAYADWLTGTGQSLGFLYLVPISYSALAHRGRVTVAVAVVCVVLRQWLSPLAQSPDVYFIRDWVLTGVFFGVVFLLARLGRQRTRFFEMARAQRDELYREVELAAEVQENLLSKNQPPETSYGIAVRFEPAKVVGGDYYDFIELPGDQLGIVVADVAGKGLAAAMLMPAVSTMLYRVAETGAAPALVLSELNRALYESTGESNYATVFYGVLDLGSGEFCYANGGHLPALRVCCVDRSVAALSAGGTPVGLLPHAEFQESYTQLAPGDLLILYTDGITESEGPEGVAFGQGRLEEAALANLGQQAGDVADALRSAVKSFCGEAGVTDDATILVVKRPLA